MKNSKRNTNDKENSKQEAETGSEEQFEQIKSIGSIITASKGQKIYCLTIIGQIEGHYILPSDNKSTKYEHVIPELVAIEEDPKIEGLLLLLNTVGGDIEAGLAIAELIAGMNKPTVSLVIGGGHSIGVPLAVAAKKSFIVRSATMTVHPVRTSGTTVGVAQTFEYFQRMQKRITNFVTANSNISEKKFYKLCTNTEQMVMDIGSVLEGEEAVNCGLIDKVGGLADALKSLYGMINKLKK